MRRSRKALQFHQPSRLLDDVPVGYEARPPLRMGAAPARSSPIVANLLAVVRKRGLAGTVRRAVELASPDVAARRLGVLERLKGRIGLEVGGPSALFGRDGLVPAYWLADRIDNCTFADRTVWEGEIAEGDTFRFHPRRAPGRQHIAEAANLGGIDSDSYDFLLSSHVIEHSANPLKALGEWRRVLRPGGLLVLIAPLPERIFDHRRPVTTLAHLLEDQARDMGEDDLTHLDEILELHDLELDPGAGTAEAFRARSLANFDNRCLHHHVFDVALARGMVAQAGFELLSAETPTDYDILVLALKPGASA